MKFLRNTVLGIVIYINTAAFAATDPRLTRDIIIDIDTTLTICCDQTAQNFVSTWTSLAALSDCNAIPITTALIITQSGSYCLANDIVGTITIAANEVVLDLNNHTVSGGSGNGIDITGSNVIVQNGRIDVSLVGIFISTGTNVILQDMFIYNSTGTGIVANNTTNLSINETIVDTVSNGIYCSGTTFGSNLNRVNVQRTSFGGITIDDTYGAVFQNCFLKEIGNDLTASSTFSPFWVKNGNDILLENCYIDFAQSGNFSPSACFAFVAGTNIILNNCSVENSGPVNGTNIKAIGYLFGTATSQVQIKDCVVNDTYSVAGVNFQLIGFELDGGFISLENCIVQACTSPLPSIGYAITGTNISLNGCIATLCDLGFTVSAGISVSMHNCISAFNRSDGFRIGDVANIVVGNCTAFDNGGVGFFALILSGGLISGYDCFASANLGGNYLGFPNTQNANTTAGVFARGNTFI